MDSRPAPAPIESIDMPRNRLLNEEFRGIDKCKLLLCSEAETPIFQPDFRETKRLLILLATFDISGVTAGLTDLLAFFLSNVTSTTTRPPFP